MPAEPRHSETKSITQLIDEAPIAPLQIFLVAICFLILVLDGFDVLAMSFAAPPIAEEWSMPAHKLGLVFSVALAGMMIGSLFISPIADKIGRRPVIIVSLLFIGISMLLTGFVVNLWQLIIMRFITGLGVGSVLASVTSTVAEYSPNRSRNTLLGFVHAGFPSGAVLGGIIAAQIIPLYGWRSIFIGGGLLTLLACLLSWFYLPESTQILAKRSGPGALEKLNAILRKMNISPVNELPNIEKQSKKPGVRTLFSQHYLSCTWHLWVAIALAYCTIYFLYSWVPKLMVDSGLPLDKAIYAATVMNLAGAIGSIFIGKLSSKVGLLKAIFGYMLGGVLSMLAFANLSDNNLLLFSLAGIIGFCAPGSIAGFYAMAARIYQTEVRTTGIGWGIGMGRFGAIFGPFIGGLLINEGYPLSSVFMLFVIPLIICGLVTLTTKLPD